MMIGATASAALFAAGICGATAAAAGGGPNVRVTLDQGSTYVSADQLAGGTYTDGVLSRCGTDRRMQNEPTLAIDPRDHSIWTAGSNDYCTVPTAGDAWAGFYRSADGGGSWTDSLLPGYHGDTSAQGTSSPLAALVAGGAIAAGDPMMSWDAQGDLFYMGNNFNRGLENGASGRTRDNTGTIWVATYAPSDRADSSTDGSKYLRTVTLTRNTFGNGQFNDKTDLNVDPSTGYVYPAWSDFHGSGCNNIFISRSTDHGATFSAPLKISSGICSNQGPSITFGTSGQVYVAWQGGTCGAFAQAPGSVNGAAFAASADNGQTFGKARLVVTYPAFVSSQFSGNGARECGDSPADRRGCGRWSRQPVQLPTGQTFPRFDLAGPYLTADNVHGTLVMAFQAAQPSGQGQIEDVYSTDGGVSWSAPKLLAPAATG